jgi:hypothetical protein
MMLSSSIFFRAASAFSSSIQSGWFQSLSPMRPNSTVESVTTEIRLSCAISTEAVEEGKGQLFENVRERFIVQEHPRVVISAIEAVLYLPYALDHGVHIRIST